jgi:hypothetical protein
MKAGTARPEVGTALTVPTTLTEVVEGATARTFVEPDMIFKYGGPTVHEAQRPPARFPAGRGTMICTAGAKSHSS